MDNEEPLELLPTWNAEERAMWVDFFDNYSNTLLGVEDDGVFAKDAKRKEARGLEAVAIAAKLADAAIREFQFRQFAQDPPAAAQSRVETQFTDFQQWLDRHRPRKRKATSKRRTR